MTATAIPNQRLEERTIRQFIKFGRLITNAQTVQQCAIQIGPDAMSRDSCPKNPIHQLALNNTDRCRRSGATPRWCGNIPDYKSNSNNDESDDSVSITVRFYHLELLRLYHLRLGHSQKVFAERRMKNPSR